MWCCPFILCANPIVKMKSHLLTGLAAFLLLCTACQKQKALDNLSTPSPIASGFVQYLIPKGEHYANGNDLKAVDVSTLNFVVRFDSSCIYQTLSPENQFDINKLYGFADNNAMHQQFSARFGWRWSDGALRLFAYTYNNAVRSSQELAVIPIGKDVHCSINVQNEQYVFSVDGKEVTMPRLNTTPTAKGYRLYPYFGGDEVAQHDIRIWIKE